MALKGIRKLFTGVTLANNGWTNVGFIPATLGAAKILVTIYGGAGTTTPTVDQVQMKGSFDGVNSDSLGATTYNIGSLALTGKVAARGVETIVAPTAAAPAMFPCPTPYLQLFLHTTNATNDITGATVEVIAYFDASRDFPTNEII